MQVLGHVQRDRLEKGADTTVDLGQRHQGAQHHRRVVAPRGTRHHQTRDVAQGGDRVVVVEVAAKTALVAQRGDAHHHRVAVLAVGEELQAGRLAADLVAGVVEIGQVLDFRDRQHPEVGVALGQAEDHRLVEQGVEHALAGEGLEQALGHRVHAAFLRHVLAEQQALRVLGQQVVQGLVDLDGEMLRCLLLRPLVLTAEHLEARLGIVGARGFGLHLVRRVRRQRCHHVFQRRQPRAPIGVFGGGEAALAGVFVQRKQAVGGVQARAQRDVGRLQQRVGGLDLDQLLDRAPLDFEVGAGVAHDAGGAQVQEGRAARASAVLDRALHVGPAVGQIEAVGVEVVEVAATFEIGAHPVARGLHRNADAVVLADEQHRRRQPLVGRPRGGVEGGLRGGVVAGRITEGTDRDAVVGNRQRMANAPGLLDGNRRAQRLRQVTGDGRGLRQHPQRLRSPDFVASPGGRVVLAGSKRQR